MSRTPGIDCSAWQDSNATPQGINWGAAAAKGVKFVFIRGAYIYLKDEDFDYNWRGSQAAGLLRGAYHYPSYMMEPTAQADFFWNIIKDEPGELPPVLDVEQVPGTALPSGENWLIWIRRYLDRLESHCGRKPIFYSNPNLILNVLRVGSNGLWLLDYPLWIAHYGPTQPLYKPWMDWTFWQYSSTGDGLAHGMESKGLDMDWFNGSEEELRAFAGLQPAPTPLELTDAEKLDKLWEAHRELH